MAEFSRATRQAKPSSQLTLRERIAAERERGAAALERSGELLAAIEGKPALAEAYKIVSDAAQRSQ